jgi:hypothetical protein
LAKLSSDGVKATLLCWQVDLPTKQDGSTAVRGRPEKFHLDVPTHLSVRDFYSQCSISGSRTLLSSSPLTTLRPVSTLSSPLSQLLATMISTSPLPSTTTGSKYRASFRAHIRRPQPHSLADNIRLLLAAETESDWHGLAVLSCFGVRGHGGGESIGD